MRDPTFLISPLTNHKRSDGEGSSIPVLIITMTWINRYWALIGGIIAIGIILFVLLSGMKFSDINTMLWFHFSLLLLHQFEEYIFPGGFREFFNKTIRIKNTTTKSPLNAGGILLVNVVFGWTAYLISAISGIQNPWLALGLLGVTVTNGLLHTTMALIKRKYVPGLISGLFLFIPFGVYVILRILKVNPVENIIPAIIVFVAGTVIIPVSIFITNKMKSLQF